jgi:hypothetical protein
MENLVIVWKISNRKFLLCRTQPHIAMNDSSTWNPLAYSLTTGIGPWKSRREETKHKIYDHFTHLLQRGSLIIRFTEHTITAMHDKRSKRLIRAASLCLSVCLSASSALSPVSPLVWSRASIASESRAFALPCRE